MAAVLVAAVLATAATAASTCACVYPFEVLIFDDGFSQASRGDVL
jgi:hypothetical protein